MKTEKELLALAEHLQRDIELELFEIGASRCILDMRLAAKARP